MKSLSFLVKGSAETPYEVRFVQQSNSNLSAYCTCRAGKNGLHCKHRLNIIRGNTKAIVSSNLKDIEIVMSWITGSDIEKAMIEVDDLEKKAVKLKKLLSAAKKNLAKAMRD